MTPVLPRWVERRLRRRSERLARERTLREVDGAIEHVGGPRAPRAETGRPLVVSLVRDGEPWIDAFVAHHHGLGCGSLVLVDNGSRDGTIDRALAHDGVTVYRCTLPYDVYKAAMRTWPVRAFARGDWCLTLDVDECFDYPHSDVVDLPAFLGWLDGRGHTALVAHMLDLFPKGALRDGASAEHVLYDLSALERRPYPTHRRCRGSEPHARLFGGIRATAFGLTDVFLTKHPLARHRRGLRTIEEGSHHAYGADLAPITGVLYHAKFTGDFPARVAWAVEEGRYWQGSAEYRRYQAVLAETPDLRLDGPAAQVLAGTGPLVARGFLTTSDDYERFAATR